MITISAFADEIGPDLDLQMDTCQAGGVMCIDVRGIDGKNVSDMTARQVAGYRKRMDARGFRVPCIGSPLGKIRLDEDFDAHLDRLKRCIDAAKGFGTSLIRIFSFYAPKGQDIRDYRDQAIDKMAAMIDVAAAAGCTLLHENEKAIYGAGPDGVKDIFAALAGKGLKCIFDPANFVEEGLRPYDDCWKQGLDDLTWYFHIKDKKPDTETCVPAGEGDGQIPQILADLKKRNWSGFMTLEPHMAAGGQFSGFTGPDLFGKAASALQGLLDAAGLPYV